jgi:hypothetical protein
MPGPLPISPDTALKLSKYLGVPIEHLMHMPRHILLQKLAEMAAKEETQNRTNDPKQASGKTGTPADGPSNGRNAAESENPGKADPS